jgi:hypothetical protein
VHLDPGVQAAGGPRWNHEIRLDGYRLIVEDLNVTPYPETRVYKKIAKAVCERSQHPEDFVLLVHEQRMFWSKPETGFRCWDL